MTTNVEAPVENSAYDLGYISFHVGLRFHCAGANTTGKAHEVMTIISRDEHIRLTPPQNKKHTTDIERWMPGLKAGDRLDSSLNLVIYSTEPAPRYVPAVA